MRKFCITDLSREDRPREKFEEKGGTALSVAELLAILIGSGNAEENAVELMQRVMNDCHNSLATLERMDIRELCRYKGMGPAKAITILASCELGKRRMLETAVARSKFDSAQSIYDYFVAKLRNASVEESHVLLLSSGLTFLGSKLISRGGIAGTVVDTRLVLKAALLADAPNIVLCHNHPSGNLRPSPEDDRLTERLKKAAQAVSLNLLDHVIVTDGGYYSYQEEGRL